MGSVLGRAAAEAPHQQRSAGVSAGPELGLGEDSGRQVGVWCRIPESERGPGVERMWAAGQGLRPVSHIHREPTEVLCRVEL